MKKDCQNEWRNNMRAIIVDDEPIMIRYFERESEGIYELNLKSSFTNAKDALNFAENNPIEVAFLDLEMPDISLF